MVILSRQSCALPRQQFEVQSASNDHFRGLWTRLSRPPISLNGCLFEEFWIFFLRSHARKNAFVKIPHLQGLGLLG